MDLVTQGVLGAAVAQGLAPEKSARRWAALGALGGLAPDLDGLIRSGSDPLLFLDFHRHFTHSLAFIPVGAALVAALVWAGSRGKIHAREAYLPCLVGYATHGLLDGCTSYGTNLLWPFSEVRVAWNIISIIDPLFTLPLLLGIVLSLYLRRSVWVRGGLALAMVYLGGGALQHQRVMDVQGSLAAERGHAIKRGRVKPAFGNNVLFRSYYEHAGRYYVDAIRVNWWGDVTVYEGGDVARLDVEEFLASHRVSATQARDLQRFEHFSAGYLVEHPEQSNVIGDLRYAFLPNAISPIWGIQWSEPPLDAHTPFVQFRGLSEERWERYLSMLWGESVVGGSRLR